MQSMDDIGLEPLNENVGGIEKRLARETNGARAALLPNIQAAKNSYLEPGTNTDGHSLQDIDRLLDLCRRCVATLIDQTPQGEAYTLEVLEPILSDLRTAQSALERLR